MMIASTSLTPREREVARLLDDHLTQAEVAAKLGISVRTVEHHAASLRQKTGSPTTRQAISRTRTRGHGPRSAASVVST
jgi:DNA-binding CsgD family transcriptional regulator